VGGYSLSCTRAHAVRAGLQSHSPLHTDPTSLDRHRRGSADCMRVNNGGCLSAASGPRFAPRLGSRQPVRERDLQEYPPATCRISEGLNRRDSGDADSARTGQAITLEHCGAELRQSHFVQFKRGYVTTVLASRGELLVSHPCRPSFLALLVLRYLSTCGAGRLWAANIDRWGLPLVRRSFLQNHVLEDVSRKPRSHRARGRDSGASRNFCSWAELGSRAVSEEQASHPGRHPSSE